MTALRTISGLDRLTYASQWRHAFLAPDFQRPQGPNIGGRGENLTITFLSLNRVSMAERLCESIAQHLPDFQGEVLAVDNGSHPEELDSLKRMLERFTFRSRIVALDQNYGVGGGRNRGVANVSTEWVLSLDNDIFFISNPLKHWQREIATVGCHFFTLSLFDPGLKSVFLRGGHLYVDYSGGDILLGGGSVGALDDTRALAGDVFLGTCMMGGACIFQKTTFQSLGGFDEEMFIGFEDIEFSLRVFQAGYKIGCSALAALVHDHGKPSTDNDQSYESRRFSKEIILKSARHFEDKHGIKVWSDGVENWLNQRRQDLGLAVEAEAAARPRSNAFKAPSEVHNQKKRILLVSDISGWAFDNIARQIELHLKDTYEFMAVSHYEMSDEGQLVLLARDFDLVHFFWRQSARALFAAQNPGYAISSGYGSGRDYYDLILGKHITTAVYDHLFLEDPNVSEFRPLFERFVDGYYTCSLKLDSIYRELYPNALPLGVVQDGVDLSLFRPRGLGRLEDGGKRSLVLGWVGDSRWGADVEKDSKGLHTVVKPAIEALGREGLAVELHIADGANNYMPLEMMPYFYNSIDILVCASNIEGTPNPVLEAMACGVPVISTDVGIVPEALGPLQREFILRSRSVETLKGCIRHFHNDRALLWRCSQENQDRIREWDWKARVEGFRLFFDSVLSRPPKKKEVPITHR